MVSDNIGKQLHDQFTRGKSLSSEEQKQLLREDKKWLSFLLLKKTDGL
jgi:hypothetical protein